MNIVTLPVRVKIGYGTNTLQPGRAETVEKKPEKEPKKLCHIINQQDRRVALCGYVYRRPRRIPAGHPGATSHFTTECYARGCNRCPECERINAIIRGYR